MAGRRIYLVGSSGYPHYGDELVAANWLRHLARTEPDAEVWLDSPNPAGVELLYGRLHPNLRVTDTLFRIAWAAPSEDPEEVSEFAAKAVRTPGFGVPHRAAGVDVLQSADVFHVIGGGYVNAIWPRHVAFLAAGAALVEDSGIRAVTSGLSLVPTAGSGKLLDGLTGGFALVDVRDAASADLLSHPQLRNTGDDGLLGHGDHVYDSRDTPSTMLCFQSDLVEGDLETVARSAVDSVKAWDLKPERVGYVEAIPGQDRTVFDMLEGELPGMRFYPFTEIWREGLPARRGQRWLTTRQSIHVAAAAAGAWGVAFPVKPGYDDVAHQDLVERGSRWAIGTPGEVAPEAHGEAGFGTALGGLVEAKQSVAEEIYAR